jgi:hypothetical protein
MSGSYCARTCVFLCPSEPCLPLVKKLTSFLLSAAELGINLPLITRKIWNILHPYKLNTDMMEDGDLSGPILVCLGFASCQLLVSILRGPFQIGIHAFVLPFADCLWGFKVPPFSIREIWFCIMSTVY